MPLSAHSSPQFAVVFLALAALRLPAAEPRLSAPVASKTIEVGGLVRHYLLFVPQAHEPKPALVILLHGSGGTSSGMRRQLGYVFDQLADLKGFVTLYPDGFERHWNDCRKKGPYSAKRKHIDDVGFLRALVQEEERSIGVDSSRVFVAGYSNGAQMAYRMALEDPDEIDGVAAMCAGLPTKDNMDCVPKGRPVSVLIMNGTADLINPFKGGDVSFLGLGDRGTVMSTADSAKYFTDLDVVTDPPQVVRPPHLNNLDSTWLEETLWNGAYARKVELVTVHGGGHAMPLRQGVPRKLGKINHDADAAQLIWDFFASLPRQASVF